MYITFTYHFKLPSNQLLHITLTDTTNFHFNKEHISISELRTYSSDIHKITYFPSTLDL